VWQQEAVVPEGSPVPTKAPLLKLRACSPCKPAPDKDRAAEAAEEEEMSGTNTPVSSSLSTAFHSNLAKAEENRK